MKGKNCSIDVSSGVTAENLVNNYQIISQILDVKIQGKRKFEVFVHYFLFRLVLINLSVDTRRMCPWFSKSLTIEVCGSNLTKFSRESC